MTNARLRFRLIVSASIILIIIAASFFEYLTFGKLGSNFIGSNGTLIAIIFASFIAYCFQQRSKLSDDLKKWWNEIVSAKSDFFLYCDKKDPSEDEYLKSFYKLSTAMDNLRVIYCNVQREENNGIGYYPFEHVRDIVDIAQFVAPGENGNFAARQKAKAAVIAIFGSLRHSIQSEATSLTPDNPVVYNSPERDRYIRKIGNTTGLDIPKIREQNKAKL